MGLKTQRTRERMMGVTSNAKQGENSVPHPEVPGRPCSVAAALQLVGERWALLAIREIFYGNQRFDQIVRNTGAPATASPPDCAHWKRRAWSSAAPTASAHCASNTTSRRPAAISHR